jgi:hypothetical protein
MANRLAVFQSLWAMEGLMAMDAAIAAIFDRVHQAGFDGRDIAAGGHAHTLRNAPQLHHQ